MATINNLDSLLVIFAGETERQVKPANWQQV